MVSNISPLLRAFGMALVAAATLTVSPPAAAFPSLEDVIARAKERSLSVTDARGDLRVAEGTMVGARVSILQNPYVEVQGDTAPASSTWGIGGFIFFPVEIFGNRGARIDEADKLIAFRKLALADAQARTVGNAIAAYGELVIAVERLVYSRRAEKDAQAELRTFEQRRQVGDATVLEQSLAEAELARWSQTRAEAELRLVTARARLAELLGEDDVDEPPEAMRVALPSLKTPWVDARAAELVQNSPLLRATDAQASYLQASSDRVGRDVWTAPNFIVNAGRDTLGQATVGGGLSWTLPVTRRNQGEVAVLEASRERALRVASTLRSVLVARARAALRTLEASYAAITEQDRGGIPAAERAVEASFASYRAGKGELLRVFIARRDLAVARFRRLDFVQTAWTAYGELAAIRGQLP
jgi:cobalt-zinc-cadmium efflux system outer membrane protein